MFGQLKKKHRRLEGIEKYTEDLCIQEHPVYLRDNMNVIKHVFNTTSVVKKIKNNYEMFYELHINNYYTFSGVGQSLLGNIDYNYNQRSENITLMENIIQILKSKNYKNIFEYLYQFEHKIRSVSIENLKNKNKNILFFTEKIKLSSYNPFDFLNVIETKSNPIYKFCVLSILHCLTDDIDDEIKKQILKDESKLHVYYSVGDNKIYCIIQTFCLPDLLVAFFTPKEDWYTFSVVEMTRSSDKVDVMIQKLNKLYQITLPQGSIDQCFDYIISLGFRHGKIKINGDDE